MERGLKMFNKVMGSKKNLKRVLALLMVLMLTTSVIPAFGIEALDGLSNNDTNLYITASEEYDDNALEHEAGYGAGWEEDRAEEPGYGYNNDYNDENGETAYEYKDEEADEEEELPLFQGIMPLNFGLSTVTLTGFGADAQVVDLTAMNATYVGNMEISRTTPQILEVTAEFTPSSTNRAIVIELDNGFGFASAPGMVGSRVPGQGVGFDNWTFNPALLGGDHATFITGAEFQRHDLGGGRTYIEQRARANHPRVIAGTLALDTLINTYQPTGGTFTYTVGPGATSITLNIGIMFDAAFALSMSGNGYFENPITVRVLENNAELDVQTLDRYELLGLAAFLQARTNPAHGVEVRDALNPTWTSDFAMTKRGGGTSSLSHAMQVLHEELNFTIRVPRQLVGVDPITDEPWLTVERVSARITENMFHYEIIDPPSGNYFLVNITFIQANLFDSFPGTLFTISGTIPTNPTPTVGENGVLATQMSPAGVQAIPMGYTTTRPTASEGTAFIPASYGTHRVIIPRPFDYALTILPTFRPEMLSGTPSITPLAPLGGFRLDNTFTIPLEDQAVFLSFPEETLEYIGVRGFRLPAGADGIQNVVAIAKTRDSATGDWIAGSEREIRIDGPIAVNLPRTATRPFAAVDLSFIPDLASDEFIISLYYEMAGDVAVGEAFSRNYGFNLIHTSQSFLYMGTIFAPIPHGTILPAHGYAGRKADLTPGNIPAGNRSDIHDVYFTNATSNMVANSNNHFRFSPATGNAGGTLLAGNTRSNVLFTINKNTYQGNFANVFGTQGIYVYLRSPEGLLNIERDSIEVTNLGNTWSVAAGTILPHNVAGPNDASIEEITDSSGSTVYRLRLPQVVIGYFDENFDFINATVRMAITALPTASASTVLHSNIFMTSAMADNVTPCPILSLTNRMLDNNTFHFGTLGQIVASASSAGVLSIQSLPEVLVSSQVAHVRNGVTGSFGIFNPANPDTMLHLVNGDQVELYVTMANNSPGFANDFYSIIPIPRVGAPALHADFQANFGFDMEFAGLVGSVPAGYAIRFATSYTATRAGTTWMELSEVTDANRGSIRSILIERTGGPIPAGESANFRFRLTPDWGTIMQDRALWCGEQNVKSPRRHSNSPAAAGYLPASLVGLGLSLGEVSGTVFIDTNVNGILDPGEVGIANVIVRAYDVVTDEYIAQTLTAADGSFLINGISVGQAVDIVATNPQTEATLRFSDHGARLTVAAAHANATTVGVVAIENNANWNWNAVNIGLNSSSPFNVTYTVTSPAPANVTNMPTSPQPHGSGTTVTIAGIPQTNSTTNASGVSGTWAFNGWNHPTITGTTFTMPEDDVAFTGTWIFTPSGNGGPTEPEMIKNPDRMLVRIGETINWTLRGFHNRSGGDVSNFEIIDMPGRGLNFQSGSLPAFTNGAGITYEIRYRVAGNNAWHVHQTGIDASQAHNFNLPQPGNLHYTEIAFVFGDVPADFALNNQIVLTFRVGAGAPNNVLVNQFLVRYDNIERPGLSPYEPIVTQPGNGGNGGTTTTIPGQQIPLDEFFVDEHIWFIRGYEDGTIRPNNNVTRAEVAMVFFRLMRPQMQTAPSSVPFTDVQGDEWYGLAASVLAHHGIFEGYEDGSFRPNRPITRREFVAVTSRFDQIIATNANPFMDVSAGDWARSYILSAAERGWFVGFEGEFRPGDNLTRAELVTVVNRMLNRSILLEDIPANIERFSDLTESHWAFAAFKEAIHTHDYERLEDGVNERWTEITGHGRDAAFNR